MILKPLADFVLVEREEAGEFVEGSTVIIAPDAVKEQKTTGQVVAVGPGKHLPDGTRGFMDVKKGDRILFSKYGSVEVTVEGSEVLLVNQKDIYAKFE